MRHAYVLSLVSVFALSACGPSTAASNDVAANDVASEEAASNDVGAFDAADETASDVPDVQDVASETAVSGDGGIGCGSSSCDLATDECCATPAGAAEQFVCVSRGGACSGGVATCDGPEDCPSGQVCCSTFGSGALPNESCSASSACSGSGAARACHDPSQCPSGWMCCPGAAFGFSGSYCAPSCG